MTAAIPAGCAARSVGRAASLSGWDDIVVPVVGMETPLPTALGDKTAKPLARQLELHTVGDLLRHYPRRYIAHTQVTHSSDREDQRFRDKEHVTLLGTVHSVTGRRMRHRKGHITEATVVIGAQRLTCTFFNQPYRERDLQPGTRALFSGDLSRYKGGWQLAAPEFIVLGAGVSADLPGLIPIYPATKKLRSWVVMMAVRQVLDLLDDPEDPLPEVLRAAHGLATLGDALRRVHLPDTWEEQRAARRRLVWDEAFGLQLAMAGRRASATSRPAPACPRREDGLAAAFDARLPFALTGAQTDGRRVARRGARRHGAAQPPAAGRRRLGQDDRRAAGDAPGRRLRTAGGAARADGGPRRAARPVAARDARVAGTGGRARRATPTGTPRGSRCSPGRWAPRPVARRCSTPSPGPRASSSAPTR